MRLPSPERAILHLDLDTFFVSVERLHDSRLQGKPIMIGGKGDRGVVASCSYEARSFGVHSGMPMRLARRLCPQALLISGDMESYSKYSHLVTDIIAGSAPLFEKASIDEFYLDLSGMDRFFGTLKWATELRQKIISESGLPISFGLSAAKMVSKVATGEAKPNGQLHIPFGHETKFLDPLPIRKIPMIGKKTGQLLCNMGVDRVKMLRQIPLELLERLLGKAGVLLWKRARGIDSSPVIPYFEAKSISTERTFEQDTIDVQRLQSTLIGMTEKTAFRLREQKKLTACISVKIRYSNFDTFSRQIKIPYTANDNILIRHALDLFKQLYDRRLLVRLVGLRFSHLVHGHYQIDLFDDRCEEIRLYQAMDQMRRKYGKTMVMRAVAIDSDKQRKALNSSEKTSSCIP